MILVDTSIWVDHFRRGDRELANELDANNVLMHPFVIGELACGLLARREHILSLLQQLPSAPVATGDEALAYIESRLLMGKGIGYVDVHLLASTSLAAPARLWTRDKRLASIADAIGVGFGGVARA